VRDEIYDYEARLRRYKRIIAILGLNGELALRLLNHMESLGLSAAELPHAIIAKASFNKARKFKKGLSR
jgi:hypothetical protein